MQKRYQIDKQRAEQEFRRFATEVNATIQMALPLVEGFVADGGSSRRASFTRAHFCIRTEDLRS